jgi:hypothetical protein
MRRLALLAGVLALGGCSASLGTVGVLEPDADAVGAKLLRPGVSGRSCRTSILGVPLDAGDPDLREAIAGILALDREGNVVRNAEVRWHRLVTGVFNRRCVEVRGDLARSLSTITLPMLEHAHP